MQEQKIELKPCPHCGKPPKQNAGKEPSTPYHHGDYYHEIYCDNEECNILYNDDIVLWWNTRANEIDKQEYERLKAEEKHLHKVCEFQTERIVKLQIIIDELKAENARLKKLDWYAKNRIKELNEIIATIEDCYSPHNLDDNVDYNELIDERKLLESLLND